VYDTGGRLLGLAEHDGRRRLWQPRLALTQDTAGVRDTAGMRDTAVASGGADEQRGGNERDG
jgi:hypothetical protein